MTQRPHGRTGDRAAGPAGGAAPSPAETWRDWVTIWQSELSALATDREAQRAWARLVEIWANQARAAAAFLPPAGHGAGQADGQARFTGAEPPAGAKAAAAAPDAGDAEQQRRELQRLARRVEELERRLARLGPDGSGGHGSGGEGNSGNGAG